MRAAPVAANRSAPDPGDLKDVQPAPVTGAGSLRFETLRNRPDFLAAARGKKSVKPTMIVQALYRQDGSGMRVGYTCSKKVGGAVLRNRAKRRLRAAAREVFPALGRAGWDYVLIGRAGRTAGQPFASLVSDLSQALRDIHRT